MTRGLTTYALRKQQASQIGCALDPRLADVSFLHGPLIPQQTALKACCQPHVLLLFWVQLPCSTASQSSITAMVQRRCKEASHSLQAPVQTFHARNAGEGGV